MSPHSNTPQNDNLDLRERIIDALVNCAPEFKGKIPQLVAKVLADMPGVTEAQIFECFAEAVDRLTQDAADYEAESDELEALAPLFDGMPEGTPLGECARIKAERGDPLAIDFLKWEAQQAGGVQ